MKPEVAQEVQPLARWMRDSKNMVVFTGAGISTESGIPDFRSPGGIWERFDPEEMTYQKFLSSSKSRRMYWELYYECWQTFQKVEPNRAHAALATLEKRYQKIRAVITQNIDGLHQKAGSDPEKVLELHGNMWGVTCLQCGYSYPWQEIFSLLERKVTPPGCAECGGLIKPATISFGQALPEDAISRAQLHSVQADVFVTIGTSLMVHPAAMLPELAKQGGAKLVIINRDPTPLDGRADLVLRYNAGDTMSAVLEQLERRTAQ